MHQRTALPATTASALRIRSVIAMLGSVLLLGACAVTSPKLAFVAPPLGSTWTVLRSDSGSFGSSKAEVTTTRGEQVWEGERWMSYEAPGFTQLLRTDGRLAAFMNGDKPIVSFAPELSIAYPLEVGKTSITHHQATLYPSKRVVPLQITQKVEAYETVTVPAGTFKALRVAWTEDNGNENVYWFSQGLGIPVKSIQRRTATSSAGPGQRVNELLSYRIK